jgi:hypothetical protein
LGAPDTLAEQILFKRNLREGIRHRLEPLNEADKQINASMDVLRMTLSNVDADRRRCQAEDNHTARTFSASGIRLTHQ